MSKQDRNIILAVLLLAALVALGAWLLTTEEAQLQASLTLAGQPYSILQLDHEDTIHFDGVYGPITVQVWPGKIRVLYADCPDQTCVKTGWIDRSGQVIVCAPNQLVIKVTGGNNPLDAVVY